MRIAVMGYSGSGKSTLSRALADRYCIPVLHPDTVQFLPNWIERDREEGRAMVRQFMQQPDWVIDGNYAGFYQAERLAAADRIILLSFNRFSCLLRAFRRYLRYRGTSRACMAEGCYEKFDWEFVRWILHDGRTRARRENDRRIVQQYTEKLVCIRTQRQLDVFLAAERAVCDGIPIAR